jgi:hypothetical protein
LQVTRVENHLSFTFEHNIIYWTNGSPTLAGPWTEHRQLTRSNLYWNASGSPVNFAGKTLATWQQTVVKAPTNTTSVSGIPGWAGQGREQGSLIADPLFVDAAKHDFRLQPNSPALQIGFKPFDYSQAGVYGDAAWVAEANRVNYAPFESAPGPTPMPIDFDFERDKVGQSPREFELSVDGRGDSILVTDETAATGHHSLKITDAAGLKFIWQPHLFLKMDNRRGRIQNSFALRLEAGAKVNYEWRDWSQSDYQTGLQLGVRDGKLNVIGKEVLELPLNQWVRFEISANLGTGEAGSWSLKVIIPGQAPREFKDLPGNPKFKALTWLGFSSDADEKTVFYLDDFSLDAEQP